ncbi:MAG TPA: hypothetical protein VEY30_13660 [Myxococcaceae bacterium]|nr:hypothetical protein [Myxococcaceae bacterium]
MTASAEASVDDGRALDPLLDAERLKSIPKLQTTPGDVWPEQAFNAASSRAYGVANVLKAYAPAVLRAAATDGQWAAFFSGDGSMAEVAFRTTGEFAALLAALDQLESVAELVIDFQLLAKDRCRLILRDQGMTLEMNPEERRRLFSRVFSGEPVEYQGWEGQPRELVIITCNRPEALQKNVPEHIACFRAYRRRTRIVVLDDSYGEPQEANLRVLGALAGRGTRMYHIGPEEKARLREALRRGMPRADPDAARALDAVLDVLLGRAHDDGRFDGGLPEQRQWAAYLFKRGLVVDDDVRPGVLEPSPDEVMRAAAKGAREILVDVDRHLGRVLRTAEVVSAHKRSENSQVIPLDLIGMAERLDPSVLWSPRYSGHPDDSVWKSLASFIKWGARGTDVMEAGLPRQVRAKGVSPVRDLRGVGLALPLGKYGGVNWVPGRNEDFIAIEMRKFLEGGRSATAENFWIAHEREPRHFQHAVAIRHEVETRVVVDVLRSLMEEVERRAPEERDPGRLAALALEIYRERSQACAELVREKVALQYRELRRKLYGPLQEQIASLRADAEALREGARPWPPGFVDRFMDNLSDAPPLFHQGLKQLHVEALRDGGTWEERIEALLDAAALAEANNSGVYLGMIDADELSSSSVRSPDGLRNKAKEMLQLARAQLAERAYSPGDFRAIEMGVFLTDRDLARLATLDPKSSWQATPQLEAWCAAYAVSTVTPQQVMASETQKLAVVRGAIHLLRRRQKICGEPEWSKGQALALVERKLHEAEQICAGLEREFFAALPAPAGLASFTGKVMASVEGQIKTLCGLAAVAYEALEQTYRLAEVSPEPVRPPRAS